MKPLRDERGRIAAIPAEQRFARLLDRSGGPDACWPWRGALVVGYGTFRLGRRKVKAHRYAYETLGPGPIPDGLVLDHLCRNRACCNPAHLEAVPQRTNVLRAPTAQATINAAKQACVRGHPYTADNTYPFQGKRLCKACRAEQRRRYRAARKAAA